MIRLAITLALEKNIITPPITSLFSIDCEGQGEVPNQAIESSLAPMWKLTGRSRSLQAAQKGSQSGWPSSATPRFCGSLL